MSSRSTARLGKSNRAAVRAVIDPVARCLARLPGLRGKLILLGLSGGADSVALLDALMALRSKFHFQLVAAHLNHALRGAESDRDEAFVSRLCGRLGVELIRQRAVGLRAEQGNLEALARRTRHAFLAAAAERARAGHIALAHQADDQAETVMMRLLRGAGATGLGAMAEIGPGKIIRPLLRVRRIAILDYLAAIGADFVEDSSNASLRHDRNRIRHRLMPLLERDYAPGLVERLGELAQEMREVDDLLTIMADDRLGECLNDDGSMDLARLRRIHPAMLRALMRRYVAGAVGGLFGFDRSHIDAICALASKGPPNGRIVLPGGWLAQRRYGRLLIVSGKTHNDVTYGFEMPLALTGTTVIEAADAVFESERVPRAMLRMPQDACRAVFDAHGVDAGLVVRNFKAGDRIAPLGLAGSRKVKDVFIEHKIPIDQRRRFPVVLLEGRVAWLPGLVRSKLAPVTADTEEVVQLSASYGRCVQFNPRASV